ncbi:hypothetical protein Tco_0277517 [Tanacetum coccineum]
MPLLGELVAEADEPMVGPVDDEIAEPIVGMEEQDGKEVWEVNEEWLMAPVTPPPMLVVPPPSTYEDLCTRMGNLEYGHGHLVKKVIQVSDAKVADGITIGEIGLRVFVVEGQGQRTATQRDKVISGLSQQVQALQAVVQQRDMQIQQLQTMVSEMSSRESTLIQCILGMDRRLADLERRPPGPKNHAMSDKSSLFKMTSFGKLFELDISKEKSVFTPVTDSCASNPTPIDCMERVSCESL